MKFAVISFLVGVAAGAGVYWYVEHHPAQTERTKQKVVDTAEAAANTIKAKVGEIKADVIKEEMARSGVYIKEKANQAGAAIADAAADTRITASIKGKFLAEPGLSSLSIHVNTTRGLVTLAGTVNTNEDIAKAVRLSLETEGVQKVISTLQAKQGD